MIQLKYNKIVHKFKLINKLAPKNFAVVQAILKNKIEKTLAVLQVAKINNSEKNEKKNYFKIEYNIIILISS